MLDKNEYYHVVVSRAVIQTGNKPNYSCETNLTKDHIINDFIIQYRKGKKLICDGDVFEASEVMRITIYFTPDKIFAGETKHRSEIESFLHNNAKKVTREFLDEVKQFDPEKPDQVSQKLTIEDVSVILNNFESAMKRWVWNDNKKWLVEDEYDIQSILYLVLRSYFQDLIYEEPMVKVGHTSSKVDFKIPSLNLLIEAKVARVLSDFKTIENQIKMDIINYLDPTSDYKFYRLIVFIYDISSSVQEHEITKRDFKKWPQIADVIIVSKPSHILDESMVEFLKNKVGSQDAFVGIPDKVKDGIMYYGSRTNSPKMESVLMNSSIESINFLTISSYLLTLNYWKDIESAAIHGVEINILVLDPTDIQSVKTQIRIYDNDVEQHINLAIKQLCKIKDRLPTEKKSNLKIYKYTGVISNGIMIVNFKKSKNFLTRIERYTDRQDSNKRPSEAAYSKDNPEFAEQYLHEYLSYLNNPSTQEVSC